MHVHTAWGGTVCLLLAAGSSFLTKSTVMAANEISSVAERLKEESTTVLLLKTLLSCVHVSFATTTVYYLYSFDVDI